MAPKFEPQNPDESRPGAPDAGRSKGKVTPIGMDMLARAAGAVRNWLSFGAEAERQRMVEQQLRQESMRSGERREPWFGPGQPLTPTAPKGDVAGRAFDYPTYTNTNITPRKGEPIGFPQLRALADNYDLLRLAIETRKDQMSKLEWSILPKKQPGELNRPKADDKCRELEKFFRRPDGVHHWDQWLRMVVEDHLVIDAVSLYKRRDRGGKPYALEVVDGATIVPMIDTTGRRPLAPETAFQQILKGVPAVNYTTEELYYCPRNPRAHKLYGMSPVEQVIMTVNIGMRRQASQLAYYTEGNVPEALIGVPESWGVEQIRDFQRYFDDLCSSPGQRRRAKFIPTNVAFQPTRMEGGLMDQYDEWLARIICYAFSLPPLPFVKVMNRATAQTSYDAALEEGLAPLMVWVKNLIDHAIGDFFGTDGYELEWDDIRKLDPAEQLSADLQRVRSGIISIDEVRASMGQEAYGLPAIVFGVGPAGFISVPALKEAIEKGLDKVQEQPLLSPEGFPMGGDPLAGAPPELMGALGGQQAPPGQGAALSGKQPPTIDSTAEEADDDEEGDEPPQPLGNQQQQQPLMRIVPPAAADLAAVRAARVLPGAVKMLRGFERRMGAR